MLILLLLPAILAQSYISEPPIKLLTTNLFGKLYNTTESEFRLSSTGQDQEVNITDPLEAANNMPTEQLVLQPGGKAVYRLPMQKEFRYLMVKPGKIEEGNYIRFCNKANITLSVSKDNITEGLVANCHTEVDQCSTSASHYCKVDLEPIMQTELDSIQVTITVPRDETRDAFLWQLHLSPLDDSERIEGTFMKEGRDLMRKTKEGEATNTWLTMVSIVGNTGVGKSTVASLLSGNETMFKSQASSSGTTTIGADISTIIPGSEYQKRMELMLQSDKNRTIYEPAVSRPLFLVDSEGMKFRGDEVDFVTTGPVAIISNVIIWITCGRLQPPEILSKINHYMAGLDRISMRNGTNSETDYGEFVMILNKMQGIADQLSNDDICNQLMTMKENEDDNAIRKKMKKKFKMITCVGLPVLELNQNESVGYEVVKRYPRFGNGLQELSNRILKESETPQHVNIGNNIYEMNSTNSETIIGMLIDGANKGNIDLSDFCNAIVSITKENIIQELDRATTELKKNTLENCDSITQSCTECVCQYKNDKIAITISSMNDSINNAIKEADSLCIDKPYVQKGLAELMDIVVEPWVTTTSCNGLTNKPWLTEDYCDISEMTDFMNQPGEKVNLTCGSLFLCGSIDMDAILVNISTDYIYVAPHTIIETAVPDKAEAGVDGRLPGDKGGNGALGFSAGNITIDASVKLSGSTDMILFTSIGGAGGDGGKGATGNETNVPSGPQTAKEVVDQGVNYDFREHTNHECWHTFCYCHDKTWFYELSIPYDACGGKGGNGGNGGNGGQAGFLTMQGSSGINVTNNRLPSAGGNPGVGGSGSPGEEGMLQYKAYHREWQHAGCDWAGFDCEKTWRKEDDGYMVDKPVENNCPGDPGDMGETGKAGYHG